MGCACHALGAAPDPSDGQGFTIQPRRFPHVERVFVKYIATGLKTGSPFYINPDLNSDALRGVDPDELLQMYPEMKRQGLAQFEFLLPIFGAIAGAAASAGTAIIAAAPAIGSLAGSVSALTSAGIAANNILSAGNQPTIIPAAIAAPTAAATARDVAGGGEITLSTDDLLLMGGAFLLVMLLRR